jgi:hypothetical protein
VPAQREARRCGDGLGHLRHGELIGPQLDCELGLAQPAEAKSELPHREGLAEQRHVLPAQPLVRVHDRPLAQPALDDPRIRQQREVPDVITGSPDPGYDQDTGNFEVYATGAGGSLEETFWSGSSGGWSAWRSLGGSIKNL